MEILVLFVVESFVFFLTFRGLSSPKASLPATLRAGLGISVTLLVAAAAVWQDCRPGPLLATAAATAVGAVGFQGEELKRLGEAMGRARFAVFLLSVAGLAALVYVFVPITVFLTSPGELAIHLGHLLSVNAPDAVVFVWLAAGLYAWLPSSRMRTVLALFAAGSLALGLLYSYALPFGHPRMTGLVFEQLPIPAGTRTLRLVVDLAVASGVGLTLRRTLHRFGARPFLIGILLADLSLGGAAGVAVLRERAGAEGGSQDPVRPPQQPLRFSRTKPNVLIVMLDRLMGGYVEEILAAEPSIAGRLSGFTWYPRTASAGENSIAGIHPLLGGYDYLPVEMNARHASLLQLSVEAFSILPWNFSRKGYQVNVVNPDGLGFTLAGDCSYLRMERVTCTHIPPAVAAAWAERMGFSLATLSESSYADLLVLLASMRAAPYVLKDVLREKGPWRPFMDHSAGTTFRAWAELRAFADLSRTDAGESNLNVVTNILPHEPYFIGEDCRPRHDRFELPEEEVHRRGYPNLFSLQHANAARCALLATADYLDFLKAAGVYDNTKIVLVSDHGIVGPVKDRSSRARAGGTEGDLYVRSRSLLLVKEIGAVGDLRISEEFLPNAEVPRIVCEEIGGCVNPYLGNKPIAVDGRNDPFFVSLVPWQFNLQKPGSFVIKRQLALRGKDPYDARGWQIVR